MGKKRIKETRRKAGFNVTASGQAKATKQSGISVCDAEHLSEVVQELRDNDAGLKCASLKAQQATLIRALKTRGALGLNTFEAAAAGWCRVGALKETWEFDRILENIIGPDGLFHRAVARYILIGPKTPSPQMELPLGGV